MPNISLIRLVCLCAALLFLALLGPTAIAQDPVELEFDLVVSGEISDRQPEVAYHFEAQAGDVISIVMTSEDSDSLRYPRLLLQDEEYELLAAAHARNEARIFHDVKEDGIFLLFATRRDARAGDEEGEFSLRLERIDELTSGETHCGSVSGEAPRFTVIRARDDFELAYRFVDGDFRPEVSVSVIDDDGKLDDVALLSGGRVEYGRMGLAVSSASRYPYILRVSSPSRVDEDAAADYAIGFDDSGDAPVVVDAAACGEWAED